MATTSTGTLLRGRTPPQSSTLPGPLERRELLATMPVDEQQLQLAGIATAVLEGGDGPPLVLLHGPGAYAAHWMRVIPGLVATHRVIAPDLPGHGASDAGDAELDVDRVLAWLGELIERTCATPPVLVGHLIGGAMGARFASRYAGRLSRLVLMDTFGLQPFAPAPEMGLALNDFLAHPDESTHERLWQQCAFDLDALRNGMATHWQPFAAYNVALARTPRVHVALHQLMQHFGLPAIAPEELARISVPTRLIWGRHDRATPLATAEGASKRYRWPLQVIDNSNDDPKVEQPQALLQALLVAAAAQPIPTPRASRASAGTRTSA